MILFCSFAADNYSIKTNAVKIFLSRLLFTGLLRQPLGVVNKTLTIPELMLMGGVILHIC
jgi:hypothetical protein